MNVDTFKVQVYTYLVRNLEVCADFGHHLEFIFILIGWVELSEVYLFHSCVS